MFDRRSPSRSLAPLALVIAAACHKQGQFTPTLAPGDLAASCDKRPILSQCSDYPAKAVAQGEKQLRGQCGVLRMTYASAPCPSAALLGSCQIASAEVRRFYKDGPNAYDEARAKRECELAQGGWFAPHE